MKQFARLWNYVRRYRLRLIMGVMLGLLSALLNFVSLPMIQKVFETWIFGKGSDAYRPMLNNRWLAPLHGVIEWVLSLTAFQALLFTLSLFIVIKLLQSVAKAYQEYHTGYIASRASIDVANDLFRNVIHLPVRFFTQARTPKVASRFANDMVNIERGVDAVFGRALVEPLYLLGALVFCYILSPMLTWILLLVMPFIAVGVWLLSKKAKRGARGALESRARLLSILSESLSAIRIVKVFQGAERERARFEEENRRLFRQNLKVVKAEAATGPFVEFFLFVSIVAVMAASGWMVIRGRMDASSALTFMVALGLAADPLRKLASVNTRVQSTIASAERVFEFMDLEAEQSDEPGKAEIPPVRESIRFDRVSFAYEPGRPVLDGIDFEVKHGEVVAIVGASGAGKTTLANLLARFYEPTSGRILFDGEDIAKATLSSVRRQIGLVSQDVMLFDDTVRANIAYGSGEPDRARVLDAARAAHVEEFARRMSEGFDTVVGEGGSMLSGGQRQRVAIARAIYKDPALLILDEATSSLDSESESYIREALDRFVKGRTTFIIAHRLATVEKADRIIVLDYGRIEAIGTHKELVEKSDVYRNLYQHQFRAASDEAATAEENP